ncbi:hypothetical protein Cs7R123_30680 [Catellatospora sp. TT07R-123]|nr:hypothetical protein Cs7R123_30680 [Catellatospora sp. TT07R-123]
MVFVRSAQAFAVAASSAVAALAVTGPVAVADGSDPDDESHPDSAIVAATTRLLTTILVRFIVVPP